MKIFRKLRQRISGILAHDWLGKPLRIGDEVLILPLPSIRPEFRGLTARVEGRNDKDGDIVIDLPHPVPGKRWQGSPWVLRRIDEPGNPSWEEVAKATGWKPGVSTPSKEVAEQ